jgi:hypothetical protein
MFSLPSSRRTRRRALFRAAPLLFVALAVGCQDPEIQQARVPRQPFTYTYEVPEGWQRIPAENLTFDVRDGEESAKVTVTSLAGSGSSLEANVARWCRQVGKPEVPAEELKQLVSEIKVSGEPAAAVDLIGSGEVPGKGRQRILGVIQTRGNRTWFIKMQGSTDLVGRQKPAFLSFVRSLNFGAEQGAPDGQ